MSNPQINLPTYAQAITALRACQALSNFYRRVNLFRYDLRINKVFILAGENDTLEILFKFRPHFTQEW